ncbi:MAG TPA: branched-chain amino acid ABC transporter permease [Clostridiaceae bacterium]|jgi:branched-chain amino acid transport system permease protein|nr:branched-chain amino acid ABC transporter permease [Clostridiaceae bacterium]
MKKDFSKATRLILSLMAMVGIFFLLFWLEGQKSQYGMLISVMQKGVILSIAAVSMNLLTGFTGLFSLGQAGFMAIGAYVTGILTIPVDRVDSVYYVNGMSEGLKSFKETLAVLPSPVLVALALIAGGLVAAIFAGLVGIPVLRLKSDYLAIATLGFAEIIRAVIASPQLDKITNGSYGIKAIPGFDLGNGRGMLLIPFGVAFLCIGLIVLLIKSSYGRAFKAIREDDIAAEAMGIGLFKHKQLSFIISSFFTAISGGLLAMFMRSIESRAFQIILTYDILLIVVIGGIGSITGSVVGAFLVTFAKEWWLRFFDTPLTINGVQIPLLRQGFRMVVFSVLLMAIVLFYRKGLLGNTEFSWYGFLTWPSRFFKRKKPVSATPGEGGAGDE